MNTFPIITPDHTSISNHLDVPIFENEIELTQKSSQQLRFIRELEFVQLLANPLYIHHLALNQYFLNPKFISYLKYLCYWKKRPYVNYIVYPNCLFFLDLIVDNHKKMGELFLRKDYVDFLMQQIGYHWLNWKTEMIQTHNLVYKQDH